MSFIGIDKYSANSMTSQLEHNIVSFLDDGLLKIGAFGNAIESISNLYGSEMSELRPVENDNYTDYTLWQSARKNWVYENISGVDYSPISISGITVSGVVGGPVFYPAPTGNTTLGYTINYKEGSVLFDTEVSSSAKVTASYSYKLFNVEVANKSNIWKSLQQKSFDPANFNNNYFSSGDFITPSEHRTQLPTIVVESVSRSKNLPWRLGDHSLISEQKLLLHVIAENKADRDKINDILNRQSTRTIDLYDLNKLVESGTYPLNFDGSLNPSGLQYDQILANSDYKWMQCRFKNITISDMQFYGIDLYGSTVEITNEMILLQNS
jgi:hypothetical protein